MVLGADQNKIVHGAFNVTTVDHEFFVANNNEDAGGGECLFKSLEFERGFQ